MSRLTWALGVPALVYLGWLAVQADTALNSAYVVEGLYRTYLPPYETDDYYVIDNRPGPLMAEIRARYASEKPAPPEAIEFEAVRSGVQALGLRADVAPGQRSTVPLRIEWIGDEPALVLGVFNRQPLLFLPRLGVALAKNDVLGPQNRALRLVDAKERPW